jgi:hypothetical protein
MVFQPPDIIASAVDEDNVSLEAEHDGILELSKVRANQIPGSDQRRK